MSTAADPDVTGDGRGPRAENGYASAPDDKEYMATLAKGLAVLAAFGEARPTMSLSHAAEAAKLSRAAARRVLRTLVGLGYVAQDGKLFSLAPRILELGFAYLSSQSWIDRAEPLMKELSHDLQESCSAAILQGSEIVYVARMSAPHRIMSTTIAIGTRLPAFHTSLGRIQLGYLGEPELAVLLRSLARRALHRQHHRRPRGPQRAHPAGSCARLLHRRRGAREGAAGARGSDRHADRTLRCRPEPVGAQQPHHAERNARAVPAAAPRRGAADFARPDVGRHSVSAYAAEPHHPSTQRLRLNRRRGAAEMAGEDARPPRS